jgi:tetratricopeptide (TPR) repeat protein
MRALLHALLYCGLSAVVAGCAGVGSVAKSDPAAKLQVATDLFELRDRPQLAEKLIRESIGSYETTHNDLGLANAYRTYGFFFRSASVEGHWSEHYLKHGFLDESATFDGRYEKSIEYLEKARTIFTDYKRFDALTTVNLNIGFTYEVMGYWDAACEAFDRSAQSNQDSLQISRARAALPQGFATYEEFLAPHRQRAGCEEWRKHPRRQNAVDTA